MTIGFYENFPVQIHWVENFTSSLPTRQLQQKLIQLFCEINSREFCFEEITNPTIPEGKIVFEFGLADSRGFSFINSEETKKAIDLLAKIRIESLDAFCAIRYYKGIVKQTPLKFDYYLLRTIFSKNAFEIRVHHERGPRYISPEDLTLIIFNKINEISDRKILKKSRS